MRLLRMWHDLGAFVEVEILFKLTTFGFYFLLFRLFKGHVHNYVLKDLLKSVWGSEESQINVKLIPHTFISLIEFRWTEEWQRHKQRCWLCNQHVLYFYSYAILVFLLIPLPFFTLPLHSSSPLSLSTPPFHSTTTTTTTLQRLLLLPYFLSHLFVINP